MNDAVVAHIGAFTGGPGVMVVAGTGSMILAVTDSGEQITNDRYEHFAGGARHLVFDTMARILIDDDTDKDERFLGEILEYWNARTSPVFAGISRKCGAWTVTRSNADTAEWRR